MSGTKKIIHIFTYIIFLLLFLTACHNNTENPVEDSYENTLLIYMCGSDLESHYGSASNNIKELLAEDIPSNTKIIIETGGAKKWRHYNISETHLSRYLVNNNNLELLAKLPNDSMGDGDTLKEFIEFGLSKYKSKKTSLIIWNHGGGGLGGVCYDENFHYDSLTLNELDYALSKTKYLIPEGFDLIGFDACLMANYETISLIDDYAKYMIASEEIEPLGGWSYINLANNLFGYEGYLNILDNYKKKCEAINYEFYSLSLIDLKKFKEVEAAFNDFALNLENFELGYLARHTNNLTPIGETFYVEKKKDLIDLGEFANSLYMNNLAGTIKQSIKAANGKYRSDATGISLYYPTSLTEERVKAYLELPINEVYKSFIQKNFSNIPSQIIKITDKGKVIDNNLSISLTKNSFSYIKNIEYKLFEKNIDEFGKESYSCLGYDSDIKIIENNLVCNINGRWLKWRGEEINLKVAYTDDELIIFDTPVKKNDTQGIIRFSYNSLTKEFKLIGFLPLVSKLASSRLERVLNTDKITLLYDDKSIAGGTDLTEGISFVMGDDFDLEISSCNDGNYALYIVITDIFGRHYRSNTALFNITNGVVDVIKDVDESFNLSY